MRNFTIITIPPADQKFVTIWIRLNNYTLNDLMLVRYGSTGSTVFNPTIREQILQDYRDYETTGTFLEDYFQVNIHEALISRDATKEEFTVKPRPWVYEQERFYVCS